MGRKDPLSAKKVKIQWVLVFLVVQILCKEIPDNFSSLYNYALLHIFCDNLHIHR